MEHNMYDFTSSISKKTVDTNKRIERQTAQYLSEHDRNLRESLALKEEAANAAALSGARFGYSSTIARSNARVNMLKEELAYNEKKAVVGMTEMVAEVVEKALLLDESEYLELNPNYKYEMRGIIADLLSEGEVNETVTNTDTLSMMEYVSRTLPEAKVGKSLTESELATLLKANRPENIDESIDKFSVDVSKQVASLMEKEQKRVKEIQDDVNKVVPPEEVPAEDPNAQPMVDENGQPLVDENGNPIDPAAMEEVPAEDPNAQPMVDENGQPLVDENGNPIDPAMMQPQAGKSIHIAPDGTTSISMPNGQLALNGDGSMDIQLMESYLIRETPRSGLFESLAVNDAQNALAEGREYNPDLHLANAVLYVTILEAMNTMGLLNVGDVEYSKIISAAGGTLNESLKSQRVKAIKAKYKAKYKQLKVQETEEIKAAKKGVAVDTDGPTVVTEGVICAQHVPSLNRAQPTDLAERIRQKRLNEQNNRTLNE